MAVGQIFWSEFSWEAFSTLFTGCVAVVGAIYVGSRQTKILDRQSNISDVNLRIQLLDRRSDCINSMRAIHHEWLTLDRLSPERFSEFHDVYNDSKLLFSKELVGEIEETLDGLFWKEQLRKRANFLHQNGETDRAKEKLEQSFAKDDKVFELMPKLLEKLQAQTRISDWS